MIVPPSSVALGGKEVNGELKLAVASSVWILQIKRFPMDWTNVGFGAEAVLKPANLLRKGAESGVRRCVRESMRAKSERETMRRRRKTFVRNYRPALPSK